MFLTHSINLLLIFLIFGTILWLVSLTLKNASIVDIFWSWFFIMAVFYCLYCFKNYNTFIISYSILVFLWGMRLSLYLFIRNKNKPEDKRYQNFRKNWQPNFALQSLFKIFWFQPFLAWCISLTIIQFFMTARFIITPFQKCIFFIGFIVSVFGFLFESISDYQLFQFKKTNLNKGKLFTKGLWAYTKHPNYFGEAVFWWGMGIMGTSTFLNLNGQINWMSLFQWMGPALITFLLLKVSGIPLLDKEMKKTKFNYKDAKNIPEFFPKF